MSLTRALAARFLLAASFFVLGAASASAQDEVQATFDRGMNAYRAGDHEGARTAFREVIAASPSHSVAVALLGESEDAMLELLIAGGEFETFAREMLAASAQATREMVRDPEAAAQDAAAVFSEDLTTRNEAIFALGIKYGPFAAPPLVAELGGANESRRLAAIYALSRMGSRITVPLLGASRSDDEQVRMGVLFALNALGDHRADARIADMAMNDASATVQALASGILSRTGDAAQLLVDQAWAWFSNDGAGGLSAVENYGVLWNCEGTRLTAYDVPQAVVAYELAKHDLLRAHELGHREASMRLAAVYGAEVAALGGSEDLAAQADAQRNALLTLPHSAINEALLWAVSANEPMIAEALIGALDGAGGRDWSGFRAALASKQSGPRIAAAIALAHQGAYDGAVMQALAKAVGYEAIRVVHVLDGDAQRATALASALQDHGVLVMVAGTGAEGLGNLRTSLTVDAFVIADPLPDHYASRVVSHLRDMERFAETPIFVIGNGQTEVESAEVIESVDAAAVVAAFAGLDSERARYETVAASAAKALAHAAHDGHVSGVVRELEAATSRADAVAIHALYALGFAGEPGAAATLQSVVANTKRSSAARSAAAMAAANLHARSGASLDPQVFQAAMLEGDAALASACARVLGVIGAGHLSAGVALQ
jgi:hypothetical protein